jgi:hypothetical protein
MGRRANGGAGLLKVYYWLFYSFRHEVVRVYPGLRHTGTPAGIRVPILQLSPELYTTALSARVNFRLFRSRRIRSHG